MHTLTQILTNFGGIFYNGIANLTPYAKNLVMTLAIIDTVLSHLKQLGDGNHIHILTWNIIKYGFFYFFIDYYHELVMYILTGFVFVGLKAGGDYLNVSQFLDPSAIISLGTDLCMPETQLLQNFGLVGVNLGQQMSTASMQFGIELSFVIIAIQVFVIALEFYIIGALAIIFLPFGANVHTRFLADKVWPLLVSTGVKLMVLAFILSAAIPELFARKAILAAYLEQHYDITSAQSIESLGTSMAIAFLCWQAPSMAAGLMTGMGTGSTAASISDSHHGMTNMSNTMQNSGGGGRFGSLMSGVSKAMSVATNSPIPDPPPPNGGDSSGGSGGNTKKRDG